MEIQHNNTFDDSLDISDNLCLIMNNEYKIFDIDIASEYYEKYMNYVYDLAWSYYKVYDMHPLWNLVKFTFKINKYEFIQPQHIISYSHETFHKSKYFDRILKKKQLIDISQPYETIIKYHPLTKAFFFYYEIVYTFNIINNSDNILLITNNSPSFIEACNYYNKQNIKIDLLYLLHYSDTNFAQTDIMINHIKQYINFNVHYYHEQLNKSYFTHNNIKYNVICCNFTYITYPLDWTITMADKYNIPFFLANIIYSLTHLIEGGKLIINFIQICHKAVADLLLICKSLFKNTKLYYPHIHNPIKFTGVNAIFIGYKGITTTIIDKLINIFEQYYDYDPTLIDKYNIKDDNIRKKMLITKTINPSHEIQYIAEFLQNVDHHHYDFIRQFNEKLYINKINFIKKTEKLLLMNPKKQISFLKKIKKKQLMHAILYATKYNLEYYNLNEKFIDEYMERNILQHMSSVDMPVVYTFKHTDNKNMIEVNDYFVNLTNKMHMLNFLIDTRDLDEYMRVSKQIRYYSPVEKYNNLKDIVSKKFDIKTSQAWLKMYELIIDTHLIIQETGTYKSFHICEAPGNFIAGLNHYIKTETKMKFEWNAQSLNPKLSSDAFGDMYGYIANYPEQWIWGVDDTGDITKEANIKFYKKYCTDVQLIAGDCGVGHDVKDVELLGVMKVHFAQLLLILHCLPEGGDFVAKLYMTQHKPIQISMLYLIYQLFDNITFYKGVVNTFSLEFYLVGRGYKGIDSKMEKRLFEILNNFDPNIDLYDNKYPEYFIYQLEYILRKLYENYKLTFDRELFYVDNIKYITDNYMTKIKDGIKYKNNDWIKRMHLKQIMRSSRL